MIPEFIKDELNHWIDNKLYGEIRIIFQCGRIQRWSLSTSKLPPDSSGSIKNPGVLNNASQGTKLEV